MDYTQIIEDFKNTQEFKDFLKITDSSVISTARQASGGTIFIGSIKKNTVWLFFSNGYVREGYYGIPRRGHSNIPAVESYSNILRRPKDAPSIIDVNLYLSGIDVILKRFKKRNDLQTKKIDKLNSNFKIQRLAIHGLFDRKSIEHYNEFEKKWESSNPNYGIEDWSWDRIIETFTNVKYIKTHRLKDIF